MRELAEGNERVARYKEEAAGVSQFAVHVGFVRAVGALVKRVVSKSRSGLGSGASATRSRNG